MVEVVIIFRCLSFLFEWGVGMEFRHYQDVQKFALKAEPVLGKREDVYSLFLVYCRQLKQVDTRSRLWRRLKSMGKC